MQFCFLLPLLYFAWSRDNLLVVAHDRTTVCCSAHAQAHRGNVEGFAHGCKASQRLPLNRLSRQHFGFLIQYVALQDIARELIAAVVPSPTHSCVHATSRELEATLQI